MFYELIHLTFQSLIISFRFDPRSFTSPSLFYSFHFGAH